MPDYGEMQRQMSDGEPPKRTAKVIPFRVIPDEDNTPDEREHVRFGVHICEPTTCGRSGSAALAGVLVEDSVPVTDSDADAHRPRPQVVVGEANPLLASALDYARRGWPVLPLHSIRNGRCTCGRADCERPGKHPLGRLVPHGVDAATTDEDTIRAWWAAAPFANIGIVTGRTTGIVALDVDPARGGKKNLDALEREHGALPETPRADTGSGGEHWYFKYPGGALRSRKDFRPGLELKADGAYVVAPPSRHASGLKYRWATRPDEAPLAEMSGWLLELVRKDRPDDRMPDEAPDKVDELPEDFLQRLQSDPVLRDYWARKPLDGGDTSMSGYALRIANRLVKDYPGDTDAQRLAILRAFYKAHGKSAALTKLRLTLKKASDGAPQPTPRGKAVIVKLADVKPTKVRWLDPGRIPLGKLTILDGDPGLGKSGITLDYAARVSTGREMPDGKRGDMYKRPAGVVILSAEDDLEDTIRPRLDAMGADVVRILNLKGIATTDGERPPTLADLDAMEQAINGVNARLVIVDPLVAHVPDTGNPNSDHKMRRLLTPLAQFAQRLGVAVLVVRHLNKRTGEAVDVSALYRGGGSIGIAGAARSVLLVASDKDDPTGERRIMARVKGNLSEPPVALAYHTEKAANGAVTVVWDGPVERDADDLVRPATEDEEASKVEEAKDWLRSTLADGPLPAKQVYSEAAKVGIARRTLERAKKTLKVRSEAEEGTTPPRWRWVLPDAEPDE